MRRPSRGFTMIELLLALGLLSILAVALVRLLDTSLNIWGRTEAGRDLNEMGSSVLDLMARDWNAIDAGPRSDLLGEWVQFDTDRDGVRGMHWPRLRLVRQATAADLARLVPGQGIDPRALGLIEVCWTIEPEGGTEPEDRSVGSLRRGERLLGQGEGLSFFDERFFSASEQAPPGSLHQVIGGVLWFSVLYAQQTTVLQDGWNVGDRLADCATSWDAWGLGRADLSKSSWNTPGSGMPAARELPILPRRVRVEIEFERPGERKRRTRLAGPIDATQTSFRVQDGLRLPEVGTMILVDEEWMELVSKGGANATVVRGRRGSRPASHEGGVLLHHGWRILREIPVALYREDWNL